jgi:hypothetical protein
MTARIFTAQSWGAPGNGSLTAYTHSGTTVTKEAVLDSSGSYDHVQVGCSYEGVWIAAQKDDATYAFFQRSGTSYSSPIAPDIQPSNEGNSLSIGFDISTSSIVSLEDVNGDTLTAVVFSRSGSAFTLESETDLTALGGLSGSYRAAMDSNCRFVVAADCPSSVPRLHLFERDGTAWHYRGYHQIAPTGINEASVLCISGDGRYILLSQRLGSGSWPENIFIFHNASDGFPSSPHNIYQINSFEIDANTTNPNPSFFTASFTRDGSYAIAFDVGYDVARPFARSSATNFTQSATESSVFDGADDDVVRSVLGFGSGADYIVTYYHPDVGSDEIRLYDRTSSYSQTSVTDGVETIHALAYADDAFEEPQIVDVYEGGDSVAIVGSFTAPPEPIIAVFNAPDTAAFVGNLSTGQLSIAESVDSASITGYSLPPVGVTSQLLMAESISAVHIKVGSASDAFAVSSSTTFKAISVLRERIVFGESIAAGAEFSAYLSDSMLFADVVRQLHQAIIAEGLSFEDIATGTPTRLAQLVDTVALLDSVSGRRDALASIVLALVLQDTATKIIPGDILESLEFDETTTAKVDYYAAVLSEMLLTADVSAVRIALAVAQETLALLADPTGVREITAHAQSDLAFEVVLVINGEMYVGWVLNAETNAPSQYTNYSFDSMCELGGRYYGVNSSGLFLLDGDDDDGAPIEASILTGQLDFGIPELKRVEEAYIGYSASGNLVLKLIVSQSGTRTEYWYEANNLTPGEPTETKVTPGKGMRSRYFQFELTNKNGADFEIDRIDLVPIALSRRI